jgi:hypothetical protein
MDYERKLSHDRKSPYHIYRKGKGTLWPDEWLKVIAREEKRRKHPLFVTYDVRKDLTTKQKMWLREYWYEMSTTSVENLKRRHKMRINKASEADIKRVEREIYVVPTKWNKPVEGRQGGYDLEGTWRAFRDDAVSVRDRVYHNGKSGGIKAEETIAYKIGEVPWTLKIEIFVLLSKKFGISMQEAEDRWVRCGWRKYFVSHGHTIYSTRETKFAKIPQDVLLGLVERSKEIKRLTSEQTTHQTEWEVMLATLPNVKINTANPQDCPRWKHVQAIPERLQALLSIQSGAVSPKIKEMEPAVYLEYICRKIEAYLGPDSEKWPVYRLTHGRWQGRNWYPVEVLRDAPRMIESDFANYLDEQENFHFDDFRAIIYRAISNFDVVLRTDGTIIGTDALNEEARIEAEKQAEKAREAERKALESEEQKRKDKELQKVHAVSDNISHWKLMTSRSVLHSGEVITHDRNEVIAKILLPWYEILSNPESHASKVWKSLPPQQNGVFEQDPWLFDNLGHWSDKGEWITLKGYPTELIDALCEVAFHYGLVVRDGNEGNVVGVDWEPQEVAA